MNTMIIGGIALILGLIGSIYVNIRLVKENKAIEAKLLIAEAQLIKLQQSNKDKQTNNKNRKPYNRKSNTNAEKITT